MLIAELGKGWDTIQALKLEGYGTSFAIDQSERFEGPYIPAQITRSMIVLPAQQIMQVEEQQNVFVFGGNTTYLLNGAVIAVKDKDGIHASDEYESLQDRLYCLPMFYSAKHLPLIRFACKKTRFCRKLFNMSYPFCMRISR